MTTTITKYLIRFCVAAFVWLVFGCVDQETSAVVNYDSIRRDSLRKDSLLLDSLRADSIARIPPALPDSSFFPEGYVIRDIVYGNLNLDPYTDAIIVLRSVAEQPGSFCEVPRWFFILTGNSKDSFSLAFKSKTVTPAQEAGQMFGEPYNGIEIDSGTFIVRHYGGSRFRWTCDYVFEYDDTKQTWFYTQNYGSVGDMLGEMNELDSTGQCIPYDRDTLVLKRKVDIRKFDVAEADIAELDW